MPKWIGLAKFGRHPHRQSIHGGKTRGAFLRPWRALGFFRNVAKTVTGVSASFVRCRHRRDCRCDDCHRRQCRAESSDDARRFSDVISLLFCLCFLVVELTSIGTQITESFAGLDRIREVMEMKTEDDEDKNRSDIETVNGTIVFEECVV